jgi:hypothetical protein
VVIFPLTSARITLSDFIDGRGKTGVMETPAFRATASMIKVGGFHS